jgi:hypothetical protein
MSNGVPPTSLRVEWSSVDDATGYMLSFVPENGSCDGVRGGDVQVPVVGGRIVRHTLQQLEEFTMYTIKVQSRGDVGVGVPSAPVSERTRRDGMFICAQCIPVNQDTPVIRTSLIVIRTSLIVIRTSL